MAQCEGPHHENVPHSWYACVVLHLLLFGVENSKDSSRVITLEKFLEDDGLQKIKDSSRVITLEKFLEDDGLQKLLKGDESPIKYNKKSQRKRGSLCPSISARDLTCFDRAERARREEETTLTGILEANEMGTLDYENTSNSRSPTNDMMQPIYSNTKTLSNWKKFFGLWKKRSIQRLTSITPAGVTKLSSKKSVSGRECVPPGLKEIIMNSFSSSLRDFTLLELNIATNNFSQDNLIGKGGFADVYKGCLQDGQRVAVKRLTKGTPDEKTTEFLSELGIIVHVDHPNTARLIGSGVEGGMHLVFELSELGSLGAILFDSGLKGTLDWSKRYKIALGTADGLMYLHENCKKRIIHRDIKADNILLTDDFEPQICDFGLAKWLPKHWTHHNVSKFEGTFGYFAPEYFMHGVVDEKTDVYAFGVLLLELITGRQALDNLQQSLVIWAKPLITNNCIEELVDESLGKSYDAEELDRVVLTANLCIEQSSILRPRMSQVVVLLRGDEYIEEFTKNCQRQSLQRTYSEELLDVQEYNSTKYLRDLRQHRQVALGY